MISSEDGSIAKNAVDITKIIGKKVLSKSGRRLGTIETVQLHPSKITVEGIWINKGLLDAPDFIAKEHIKTLDGKGALLKIDPVTEIKGRPVYDVKGRKVGNVGEVRRSAKSNNLSSILVERGNGKKSILVSSRKIRSIGNNVLLNIQFRE